MDYSKFPTVSNFYRIFMGSQNASLLDELQNIRCQWFLKIVSQFKILPLNVITYGFPSFYNQLILRNHFENAKFFSITITLLILPFLKEKESQALLEFFFLQKVSLLFWSRYSLLSCVLSLCFHIEKNLKSHKSIGMITNLDRSV